MSIAARNAAVGISGGRERQHAKLIGLARCSRAMRGDRKERPGAPMASDNRSWRDEGHRNREAVRSMMQKRLGITQRELAEATGLSPMVIGRHVSAIRAEWMEKASSMKDPRTDSEFEKRVKAALSCKSMRRIGMMMAMKHRYAIDYIEQAPILVLLASRGVSTGDDVKNDILARSFRVATEGRKLRDALAYYGAPLVMRKLRGRAISLRYYRVIQLLREMPPSDLSQAIPEKPSDQRDWLDGLVPMIAWAHHHGDGGERFTDFLFWAAKASAKEFGPDREQHRAEAKLYERIADLYDMNRRGRFNYTWTFAEAEAAAERWHAELAAEKDTAEFAKKHGRAFNEIISYAPLPEAPNVVSAGGGDFVLQPLQSAEALFIEGRAMGHCVATYCDLMFSGASRIYSIRLNDQRVATLELAPDGKLWKVKQLRARFNKQPDNSVTLAANFFCQSINNDLKRKSKGIVRKLRQAITAATGTTADA